MAEEKSKKGMKKKKDIDSKKENKPLEDSEEKVPEKVKNKENKQLFWFFSIIILIFASFLIPYFYTQSQKTFEYGFAEWAVEDYDDLTIYHGRFDSFGINNLIFNLYLRNDPRENSIETIGTFDKFKYGTIISFSSEVNECRGEIPRASIDLSSFLKDGIGTQKIEIGTTDKFTSVEEGTRYAVCDNIRDRTLVILEKGEESLVVQNETYPYCYTIYIKDCEDSAAIEKFITKSLVDMGELRASVLENSTNE